MGLKESLLDQEKLKLIIAKKMLNVKSRLFASLVVILSCCTWDPNYSDENKAVEWEKKNHSFQLTEEEKEVIDSLQRKGIGLSIERSDVSNLYTVKIDANHLVVTTKNMDSINEFRRNLAINLYNRILINNSFIQDYILIDLGNLKFSNHEISNVFRVSYKFSTDSLSAMR